MEVIRRACPACDSRDSESAFGQPYRSIPGFGTVDYEHRIVLCRACGLAYADPCPSNNTLGKYYSVASNYENPQRGGQFAEPDVRKWERACDLVEGRFPAGFRGRALEIGCATGVGLAHFKKRGWEVLGVDPSAKAATVANQLHGIEVMVGMFKSVAMVADRAPFDLVVLSHVVEHLVEPAALVEAIRPAIARNGLMYVEVPNLLRPNVPMGYFMFEHLNYFTPATLGRTLARAGFREDHVETFDNSAQIEPFYPVISATYAPGDPTPAQAAANDYAAARAAIDGYRASTGTEIDRIQARVDEVIAKTGGGRLALWGAGLHTSQLLALADIPAGAIACIFDNDPKRDGTSFTGIPVIASRRGENDFYRRHADAILISSKAAENEIHEQIRGLEAHGVKVYKLYG